jgi:zinc protease
MSPARARATRPREVPGLTRPRRQPVPRVSERRLANGLRVVAVRRPAVPLVHVRLRVPSGARRPDDVPRTELLARSALLGTHRRSEEQLADDLLGMGGSLRVGGDADGLRFAGEALAPELGSLLEALGEVLVGSTYPRRSVEREAGRFAESAMLSLSQPAAAAGDVWARTRYGVHPYARRITRPDEVLAIPAGSLRALHRRRVVPDGAVLVVVGDVAPARALDLVERHLSAWEPGGRRQEVPPVPAVEVGPVVLAHRPGSVQANLRLGGNAPRLADPSYAATRVADALFAGMFSSRLVANLREDKGWTYSPGSVLRHQRGGSSLTVGIDVATEVAAPALVETLYELGRMVTLPPEPDEVSAAVQYLIGTSVLVTATQSGLADHLLTLLTNDLDVSWMRDHPARLAAVTPDEVREAARGVLSPSRLVVTVLGDADALEGPLSSVTEVTRVEVA